MYEEYVLRVGHFQRKHLLSVLNQDEQSLMSHLADEEQEGLASQANDTEQEITSSRQLRQLIESAPAVGFEDRELEIRGLKRILRAGASFEMKTDLLELVFFVQYASYRAEHKASRNDDVIDLLDIATEVEFRNSGYPDEYVDEEDEDWDD